jgi:hypothetical protein
MPYFAEAYETRTLSSLINGIDISPNFTILYSVALIQLYFIIYTNFVREGDV